MLIRVKELHGTTIHALDGEIGKVDEILFDDDDWTVRYLIADTGNWLASRKVLLSPVSFGQMDWHAQMLNVNLTSQQIKDSPGVDTDKPVSRQWEARYYGYYGWPHYWGGMGTWGYSWYPGALIAHPFVSAEALHEQENKTDSDHTDSHLQSTKDVSGYGIAATDGHIGHIEDFIVDDETWKIRYLAVDTRDWLPGKKVLLPPDWIDQVNWPSGSITVKVTRDQVKNAPEWDRDEPISGTYEDQLHRYYGRQRPTHSEMPKKEDVEELVPMF